MGIRKVRCPRCKKRRRYCLPTKVLHPPVCGYCALAIEAAKRRELGLVENSLALSKDVP